MLKIELDYFRAIDLGLTPTDAVSYVLADYGIVARPSVSSLSDGLVILLTLIP